MKKLSLVLLLLFAASLLVAGEELSPGAKAPAFSLRDATTGQSVAFQPGNGKISAVVFTCNSCPYSKAFEPRLAAIGRDYAKKGVVFFAVNPNDDGRYPAETLDEMKERAADKGFPFPYLKDADSSVAAAYGARVTPHVFVVDGAGIVRYRGYVDDSAKPAEREHTGLTDALDALLANRQVSTATSKAFGCSIKWKNKA